MGESIVATAGNPASHLRTREAQGLGPEDGAVWFGVLSSGAGRAVCGSYLHLLGDECPPHPPPKKGLCHRAVVKSKEAEGGGPELGAA